MGSKYIRFSRPGISGIVEETGSNCAFDPVSLLEMPADGTLLCKNGNTVQAWKNGALFVKRVRHGSMLRAIRHIFEPPRPAICLRAAKRLAEIGIPTPHVTAALRQYRHGLPVFDYLVTQDISSTAVFADALPLTGELAEGLTELLAKLHAAGIEHGDANLRNFYRTNEGVFGVIDLDACRLGNSPLPRPRRIRELARLASSFSKLAAERGTAEPLPDLAGYFAELYARCAGIETDSRAYRKRFSYLAERKRKQHVRS
ncbi:MAG: phosphotransferase [Lentisphaeria bacterium]|nr:phosphotransferase [Lentisphaeria bacterium]